MLSVGALIAASGSSGHGSIVPGWSVIASILALFLSVFAIVSNYWFRKHDALANLLERFETNRYHVRTWRVEQATRVNGDQSWMIRPRTVKATKDSQAGRPRRVQAIEDALATDWGTERADMQALYFFALQVRAWLPSNAFLARRWGAPLLNRTFGYQLLSTFLDQRITACRLLPDEDHVGVPSDHARTYYPTHYGLFDKAFSEVVDWLAADLLKTGNDLPKRIRQVLGNKRKEIAEHLAPLKPQLAWSNEPENED
jgi:hypothetical protein